MSQKNSLVTFGVVAAIIAVIIGIRQLGFLKPVNNALAGFFSPLARHGYWLGNIFQNNSPETNSLEELQQKIAVLEPENHRLLVENAELSTLKLENEDLRKQLQFFNTGIHSYVVANVLAREKSGESTKQQSIIIDRGSADGIGIGMPIVDSDGVLLGKVTSTEDHISEACLLFNDACRFAVSIQGQAGTIGVVQSDLALTVKVDFIPHGRVINEQEVIVTSGLEANMPAGLVLGRVSRVIQEGNEIWQHALIEPLGNFDHMRIISVIK